jgi:hypothetical protein
LDLKGEFTFTTSTQGPTTSQTITVRVHNDLWKGTEGTPLAELDPAGWLEARRPAALELDAHPVDGEAYATTLERPAWARVRILDHTLIENGDVLSWAKNLPSPPINEQTTFGTYIDEEDPEGPPVPYPGGPAISAISNEDQAALIHAAWAGGATNGRVILDGADVYFVRSATGASGNTASDPSGGSMDWTGDPAALEIIQFAGGLDEVMASNTVARPARGWMRFGEDLNTLIFSVGGQGLSSVADEDFGTKTPVEAAAWVVANWSADNLTTVETGPPDTVHFTAKAGGTAGNAHAMSVGVGAGVTTSGATLTQGLEAATPGKLGQFAMVDESYPAICIREDLVKWVSPLLT